VSELEGTTLGRYRLDRFLGEGSTSQVYLATHVQLGRRVAIKVISPRLLLGHESIERVIQEARIVNQIRHPNIAEVFDVVESDQPLRVALVMEFVEGPSLAALGGKMPSIEQAVGVSLQLVSALETTHAAGVVHRDLKPDNLLFTRDPRIGPPTRIPRLKIIDFGVAKLGSHGKTVAGRMIGTPAYMAPEQVAGAPPTSPATDVFAVGEIMYELLCGERAYPQTTIQSVVRVKLRGPKPELKGLDALPEAFRTKLAPLLHRCLALSPGDRATLGELREALIGLVSWEAASGPSAAKLAMAMKEPHTVPWLEALDEPLDALGEPGERTQPPDVPVPESMPVVPPPADDRAPRRNLARAAPPRPQETAVLTGVVSDDAEETAIEGQKAPTFDTGPWLLSPIPPAQTVPSMIPPLTAVPVPLAAPLPAASRRPAAMMPIVALAIVMLVLAALYALRNG